MITEKRWLLVTDRRKVYNEAGEFEAITCIKATKLTSLTAKIEEAFSRNMTPIFYQNGNMGKELLDQYRGDMLPVPTSVYFNGSEEFTRWCYEHGFEPGERSTGEQYDTKKQPCILCGIAHLKGIATKTVDYNRAVEKEVDCILYESHNFYVVCELGALKPGYLMIVPKDHEYLSIAQIDDPYIYAEYEQVCEDVETILKGAFGEDKPVVFMEHGSGPSGFTSHKKSIVHAHTHVVIDFTLKQQYLDAIQMKPLDDLSLAKHTHYFAYKVGAHGQRFCCYDDSVYVQRQYPRQVMAKELGLTPLQYNWRKYDFQENTHATLYQIWHFLKRNFANFDSRIQKRTCAFYKGYPERENFRR